MVQFRTKAWFHQHYLRYLDDCEALGRATGNYNWVSFAEDRCKAMQEDRVSLCSYFWGVVFAATIYRMVRPKRRFVQMLGNRGLLYRRWMSEKTGDRILWLLMSLFLIGIAFGAWFIGVGILRDLQQGQPIITFAGAFVLLKAGAFAAAAVIALLAGIMFMTAYEGAIMSLQEKCIRRAWELDGKYIDGNRSSRRLRTLAKRILRAKIAQRPWLQDTIDLVVAYMRAKKQRVCPPVHFVNGAT